MGGLLLLTMGAKGRGWGLAGAGAAVGLTEVGGGGGGWEGAEWLAPELTAAEKAEEEVVAFMGKGGGPAVTNL